MVMTMMMLMEDGGPRQKQSRVDRSKIVSDAEMKMVEDVIHHAQADWHAPAQQQAQVQLQ